MGGDNDPQNSDGWPKDREIRAAVIGWLCVDQNAARFIGPKGLFVFAARIAGVLDLSFATVACPLDFGKCCFTEPIKLQFAEIKFLEFSGTVTPEINADGIVVHGGIHMRNGFQARGGVRLVGASVGGNLDCSRGNFMKRNGDASALDADAIKVKGAVIFRDGFRADGEVHIVGAEIGIDLDCSGGKFVNPSGSALCADGIKVAGSIYLRRCFSAEGEVRFLSAAIGRALDCTNGKFARPGRDSLNADGIQVGGDVVLCNFASDGKVRLIGADIGGDLHVNHAQFEGGGSLTLERARVKADFSGGAGTRILI
jgi:hypothetical protein